MGNKKTKGKPDTIKSPEERQKLILPLLGTMTIEDIAKRINVCEKTLYTDLKAIREERDLIHPELVQHVAEEQFNRLSSLVRLNYKDLVDMRIKLEFYAHAVDDGGDDLDDNKKKYEKLYMDYFKLQYQYRLSEDQLTKFLRAVGRYSPEINIQNIETQNTGITVVFAKGLEDAPKPKKEREINPGH